ncbi:MAG: hypothetical protein JXR11_00435 [Balneola sp.]
MTFRISLLLILITGFVLSCSTGPEFERDNLNDPESGQFSPDVGNLALSIDSSKDVTLIWNDISDFEDGFIIQKSYENKESFFDLDTLPANSSRYIDSTKKLAVDTFYRVRSFSESSDSLGSSKVEQLILDPLKSIRVPDAPGNKISISWENNDYGYVDAYMIQKRVTGEQWNVVDTVASSVSNYSYTELENIFFINIKITPLILDYKNELVNLNSGIDEQIELNYPTNFNVVNTYEDEVKFSWTRNSIFKTNFKIEHYINNELIEEFRILNDSVSLQTLIKPSNNQHTYVLSAFIENKTSKKISRSKSNTSTPPYNFKIETADNNSIKLTWSYYIDSNARNIVVERSINDKFSFEPYKYLPTSARQFVDDNLDEKNKYYYRLKTLSSRETNTIGVINSKGLQITDQLFLHDRGDGPNGNLYYKITDDNRFLIKAERNSYLVSRFNILNKQKIEKQLDSFVVHFIRFSKDQKHIALIGEQLIPDYSGPFIQTVKILDFETLEEIQSFRIKERYSGVDAIGFTHDSNHILIYQFDSGKQEDVLTLYNTQSGNVDSTYNLTSLGPVSKLIRNPTNDSYLLHSTNGILELDLNTLDRVLIKNLNYEYTSNTADLRIIDNSLFFNTRIGVVSLNLLTNTETLFTTKNLGPFTSTKINNDVFYTNTFNKVFYFNPSTNLNSLTLDFSEGNERVRDISYSEDLSQILIIRDRFLFYTDIITKWNITN